MAAVTLAGMAGCSQRVPDVSGQVEQKLEAKYHEKFSVSKVYGGSLVPTNVFADTYKLICYPENNPNLKFKAELSPNGVFYDAYCSANVNAKVEKLVGNVLKKKFPDVIIKSVAVGPYLDSANKDMSIEDFFKEQKSGFTLYITIKTDKSSAHDIYRSIQTFVKILPSFHGCVYCYCANQQDYDSCKKLFNDSIEINSNEIEEIMKYPNESGGVFTNKSLSFTVEEFAKGFEAKGEN